MITGSASLTTAELRRFKTCPVDCPKLRQRIESLADYFAVISSSVGGADQFWFRGHEEQSYSLTPSALRYSTLNHREAALDLMMEFRRIAEIKLDRPPRPQDELKWAQIAQHYGLPTRLLDWTESATTALFFACAKASADGIVFVLNPAALNGLTYPLRPRILDTELDKNVITKYLRSGPREAKGKNYPIAINPVWNSQRLIVQKGVFTLHGKRFSLDKGRIPSLVAVPILEEFKPGLLRELQRIGVDEMTMFPELEHATMQLKRRSGLIPIN
jgi:hypothetical protein